MAELRIDVEAIGRNTEAVVSLLRPHSLELVAVTKGCLGEPRVAAAMLAGGAVALADTRDRNLRRLRSAFPKAELHRIHLPSLSEPFEPGDVTYVTSREGAAAVAGLGLVPAAAPGTAAASIAIPAGALVSPGARVSAGVSASAAAPRRVMLQVETGDEREGVPEGSLLDLAGFIAEDPRLMLEGVSTNYACFLGPPAGITGSLERVARAVRTLRSAGFAAGRVSGGNSSVLWLLKRGQMLPGEITELRCGEALLLGQDALCYEPVPGCSQRACVVGAEVLEEYTRPAPGGRARRVVLGIGRQDLGGGAVTFLEPALAEVGRSADYLVAEVEAGCAVPALGSVVEMLPAYEALVAVWTSPYVAVTFQGR